MTDSQTDITTAAAAIVADIAGRLRDPTAVAARMAAADSARTQRDGASRPAWYGPSLATGYPGLALLFAELRHTDDAYDRAALACLAPIAETMAAGPAPPPGLHVGPIAFAFATSSLVDVHDDFRPALQSIDRRVAARIPVRLRPELARIRSATPGTTFDAYDVVAGATGIGRYLLRRGVEPLPALTAILSYLTALAQPPTGGDPRLPGWWVGHGRYLAMLTDDEGDEGHANLGLAHGICGPLALLSLAWRAGVRVPGQDEAIARIVDWLLVWREPDVAGRYWPAVLSLANLQRRPASLPRARSAWCYGAPGVARAIQLAGLALGRADWTAVAEESTRSLLANLDADHGVIDAGLCHGWAGLLHLTRLIGIDAGDRSIVEGASQVVARIVDNYDPQAPFAFRAARPGAEPVDTPGYLDGAAGIALALHSYLSGTKPVTGWDAALLVA
ncbi:lanthionine synthetase C family protein [Micromonospora sp. WMMD1102]|uniref:lanthionine synthetase C family protein n=1 Tax=Micromonospora sp. WMMD1102 TaxID=3016105 RepID=UPI00241508D9|nr:lanthionine synthetase C family protein [Micromonospora sp. WMMD1102]MDG4791770.1 lanthionine synthetase C family protein [Micromonospora sp. WMMD1102]